MYLHMTKHVYVYVRTLSYIINFKPNAQVGYNKNNMYLQLSGNKN